VIFGKTRRSTRQAVFSALIWGWAAGMATMAQAQLPEVVGNGAPAGSYRGARNGPAMARPLHTGGMPASHASGTVVPNQDATQNPANPGAPAAPVSRSKVWQQTPGSLKFYSVIGAIVQPGTYASRAEQTTAQQVIQRAGGLRPGASPSIAIIRYGRAGQYLSYRPEGHDPLLPGDILVTEVPNSYRPGQSQANTASPNGVSLAFLGLAEYPIAVQLPTTQPTVAQIMAMLDVPVEQSAMVKVIASPRSKAAAMAVSNLGVPPLPDGAVLVFPGPLPVSLAELGLPEPQPLDSATAPAQHAEVLVQPPVNSSAMGMAAARMSAGEPPVDAGARFAPPEAITVVGNPPMLVLPPAASLDLRSHGASSNTGLSPNKPLGAGFADRPLQNNDPQAAPAFAQPPTQGALVDGVALPPAFDSGTIAAEDAALAPPPPQDAELASLPTQPVSQPSNNVTAVPVPFSLNGPEPATQTASLPRRGSRLDIPPPPVTPAPPTENTAGKRRMTAVVEDDSEIVAGVAEDDEFGDVQIDAAPAQGTSLFSWWQMLGIGGTVATLIGLSILTRNYLEEPKKKRHSSYASTSRNRDIPDAIHHRMKSVPTARPLSTLAREPIASPTTLETSSHHVSHLDDDANSGTQADIDTIGTATEEAAESDIGTPDIDLPAAIAARTSMHGFGSQLPEPTIRTRSVAPAVGATDTGTASASNAVQAAAIEDYTLQELLLSDPRVVKEAVVFPPVIQLPESRQFYRTDRAAAISAPHMMDRPVTAQAQPAPVEPTVLFRDDATPPGPARPHFLTTMSRETAASASVAAIAPAASSDSTIDATIETPKVTQTAVSQQKPFGIPVPVSEMMMTPPMAGAASTTAGSPLERALRQLQGGVS
jgi:nicotinate-nucleotide--dimethylbenzimidazole phosphoribosyltransferase